MIHWPVRLARRRVRLGTIVLLLFATRAVAEEGRLPVPPDEELEASGAVIGEIIIDNRNIFDLENPKEDKALFRWANRLHIRTRPSVIRAQLLFEPGDPYRRRALDESERLLRSNDYLYEARIEPVGYENGEVQVRVFTRDVWTLLPGISFSRSGGENRGSLEIEDENFLGRGGTLALGWSEDEERQSTSFNYSDRHLGASWLSLGLTWEDNSDGHARALTLDHPFYALDTRWASGGAVRDELREDSVYEEGDEIAEFRHDIGFATAYYGWSAGLADGWTRRWYAGVVYDEHDFALAPGEAPPLALPEDRKLVYPYLGVDLVEDQFLKAENLDQIERIEDFALGAQVGLRLGWINEALGSDRNGLVFSANVSQGFGSPSANLLFLNSALSGRYEDGALADTLLGASARYYRRVTDRGLFFVTVAGDVSEDLDLDDPLELGGDNGLRGYPLRYQRGTARALLTIEQRWFTDIYLFRLFRVGGAAFFDIGRTWGDNPQGVDSQGWLRDVGMGLRFASTRSSLGKMIHVDLAFPLDGDEDIDNVQLLLEGKRSF